MSSESLFALHQGWEVLPLGEVCRRGGGNVQTGPFGSQLHASDYVSEGIPSVMPQNIGDNKILDTGIARITKEDAERLSKYRVREGDIVYSRRGDVERRALVRKTEDGWLCGTGCLRIRFGDGIVYPRYAAHYLGHPSVREWIVRHAHGATMPNLNTTILSELPFVLPPWNVQVLIGDAIEAYDEKLDLNHRVNQTLEAMAQAIFKSWFVDFDPVKAKIAAIQEGRDPLRAAMTAISGKPDAELDTLLPEQYAQLSATSALFPDEMEDSELGDIPKGWAVAHIQDVVEGVYDGPHATPPEATEGAVFLGIRNMTGTSLDMSDVRHIAEADWAQWTRRIEPRAGDIVFSYEATLGYFALLPSGLRCCLGRRLALIRPRVEQGFGSFWFHQFVAPPFQRFLEKHTIPGATVNRIALKDFPSFPVLKPATAIQSSFCERVDSIWSLIHSNQTQSERLEKLRDTLLPKLLSGELQVHSAEAEAVA